MKYLNSIAKIIVIALVITVFIMVITSCAYVSGSNNNVSVTVDRKVEIESTIKAQKATPALPTR